jgi:hypothetical protein
MMEMIVTGKMVGNILTKMRRFENNPIIFIDEFQSEGRPIVTRLTVRARAQERQSARPNIVIKKSVDIND